MQVHSKNVLSYALLPGIIPRLRDLMFSGSDTLNYFIARLLFVVRLLPVNHSAFNPKGLKKSTLRGIMADAANNLKFDKANIDQVIVFIALTCGIVMSFLYLLALFFFVMFGVAHAGGWSTDLFQTVAPEKDLAFMMLDKVFGIPGLFGSEVSTNAAVYGAFPSTIHIALHQLLWFYSMGILIIAIIMFLLHVVEFVFDLTQDGHTLPSLSDEEKGFSWLPIRYLLAFGLLIPFGMGLNSAQWITLYMAKLGSGLATNSWIAYNIQVGTNPTGENSEYLTAKPKVMDNTGLIRKLLMMKSCMQVHQYGAAYLNSSNGTQGPYDVAGYIVSDGNARPLMTSPGSHPNAFMADLNAYNTTPAGVANFDTAEVFPAILDFTDLSDITIVLGYHDPTDPKRFKEYLGGILPVCGSVNVPVTGISGHALYASEAYFYAVIYTLFDVLRPGKALDSIDGSSELASIREYLRVSTAYRSKMNTVASLYGGVYPGNPDCMYDQDNTKIEEVLTFGDVTELGQCTEPVPSAYWTELINDYYQYAFELPTFAAYDYLANTTEGPAYSSEYTIGDTSFSAIGADNPFMMSAGILERGWGGAGIWYNKISELNGALFSAISAVPDVVRMPLAMEQIASERAKTDKNTTSSDFCDKYNPRRSGTTESGTGGQNNQFNAELISSLHTLCKNVFDNQNIVDANVSGAQVSNANPVMAAISSIFAQAKLFDMRENDNVAPMVQLSAIGKLIIDKAIFNLMTSVGSSVAGGIAHITGNNVLGQSAGALSSFLSSLAMIGMGAGVMLHYIIPFMPFLYFFFAVAAWVKTIFEAMVGVPLWALAHLRKDGPGLTGSAAFGGYVLLLEILIRPIITVFALIITFAVFSALVSGLNSVFSLMVSNAFGADTSSAVPTEIETIHGVVDQFFFTILYIVIVYIMALSCFKLINIIPDGIIRWLGADSNSFGRMDDSEKQIDTIPSNAAGEIFTKMEIIKKEIDDVIYKPAAQYGARKAAEEKALKDQKDKEDARQAEKLKNQPTDGGGQ